MYAKSFMASDGNQRLTGARTAKTAPYNRCHLCGSTMTFHPEYHTERPPSLNIGTARGRESPDAQPERTEIRCIEMLCSYITDTQARVRKVSWCFTSSNTGY
ncbi:hypothetical protein J8631_15160 [Serratia fonticola]|nr:hypothetical protein [Serratia fonticola]MBP1036902.1 hypothetical protein [Serratia fonticola]